LLCYFQILQFYNFVIFTKLFGYIRFLQPVYNLFVLIVCQLGYVLKKIISCLPSTYVRCYYLAFGSFGFVLIYLIHAVEYEMNELLWLPHVRKLQISRMTDRSHNALKTHPTHNQFTKPTYSYYFLFQLFSTLFLRLI